MVRNSQACGLETTACLSHTAISAGRQGQSPLKLGSTREPTMFSERDLAAMPAAERAEHRCESSDNRIKTK